jgi:bifunctional lysine-specific demethylase and histidyl-hydroxylase NO66
MTALHRLANNRTALEEKWERAPHVSTGLDPFTDIFSLGIADRLIHSGLPISAVRMYRNGTRVPSDCIVAENPGAESDPRADGVSVIKQICGGATVILDFVHLYCPEVSHFTAALAREVGYTAHCTAFITPAGSRGVAPHYDTPSVFLRQITGSKRWRIFAPIDRWPTQEWRSVMNVESDQLLDVSLNRSDCLYIPRGFIHVGDAESEGSVHLTIGMSPPTWVDVLRLAAENCHESEELREAIPPRFMQVDETALFRQKLAALQMPAIESLRPPSALKVTIDLALALGRPGTSIADT